MTGKIQQSTVSEGNVVVNQSVTHQWDDSNGADRGQPHGAGEGDQFITGLQTDADIAPSSNWIFIPISDWLAWSLPYEEACEDAMICCDKEVCLTCGFLPGCSTDPAPVPSLDFCSWFYPSSCSWSNPCSCSCPCSGTVPTTLCPLTLRWTLRQWRCHIVRHGVVFRRKSKVPTETGLCYISHSQGLIMFISWWDVIGNYKTRLSQGW